MKFVIGTGNVKIFAKSILALSKIGDEIYVEPMEQSLTLRTVNSSRSAFSYYEFKESFFTHFEPELSNNKTRLNNTTFQADQTLNASPKPTTSRNQSHYNDESMAANKELFKCKIPARCLLSIFKNINSLEKTVEKCTITVKFIPISQESASKVYDYDSTLVGKRLNKTNEEQLYDVKFLVIMSCKFGMRKTFILSISDCENLQAAFSTENCSNRLSIGAKYLNETINCFSNDIEEVSFIVKTDKLYIKNYMQPESGIDAKSLVNTQVNFDCEEFNEYTIDKETDITFCLKEFKICLLFGYYFDLTLDIFFKRKGRPIIFVYSGNSTYKASFTLATLADELINTQSTLLSSNPNISIFPTEQLDNENNKSNKKPNPTDRGVSKIVIEKIAKTSRIDMPLQITRANKRTLFDASNNQNYLDDSVALNESRTKQMVSFKNVEQSIADDDDDDDDVLLTQALELQESKAEYKSNTPPAKKVKSLVQTLFEDDENENMTETRLEVTKSSKKISVTSIFETSQTEEHVNKHNSIYIENTSSEDED